MELKEFIRETIGGIIEATTELQEDYEEAGILINPPVSIKERDLFEEGNAGHTYRRVEAVDFDVAVTATSETAGGGKAGLRILSVEAGVDGSHSRAEEHASRVRFSIPIALGASAAETRNKEVREENRESAKKANAKRQARRHTRNY